MLFYNMLCYDLNENFDILEGIPPIFDYSEPAMVRDGRIYTARLSFVYNDSYDFASLNTQPLHDIATAAAVGTLVPETPSNAPDHKLLISFNPVKYILDRSQGDTSDIALRTKDKVLVLSKPCTTCIRLRSLGSKYVVNCMGQLYVLSDEDTGWSTRQAFLKRLAGSSTKTLQI